MTTKTPRDQADKDIEEILNREAINPIKLGVKTQYGKINSEILDGYWPRRTFKTASGTPLFVMARPHKASFMKRIGLALDVLFGKADAVYWYKQ